MFVENLAPFFDVRALGTAANYGAATIAGIFESGFAAAQVGLEAGVEGARYTYTCPVASVPGVDHGSTLVIDSVTYTVRGVQPDGTGVVTLILEAP